MIGWYSMSQKNQTLEGAAARYAESCVKTGEPLKDLATAFLDGYWTCQRDMLGSMVVPVGNRWWYYDADVIKGGLHAADKKGTQD